MKQFLQVVFFLLAGMSAFGEAQTQVRMALSEQTVCPGDTIWVAFDLKMPKGWHTYWRNGGDSGIPTRVDWTLPTGITAGELQWPVPKKLSSKVGDIEFITYVYDKEVVLLAPLKVADIKYEMGKILPIQAKVSWQECQEMCIAGRTNVAGTVTIGKKSVPSSDAHWIEESRKKIPALSESIQANIFWTAEPAPDDTRPFLIEWMNPVKTADFFPYISEIYEVQAATVLVGTKPGKIQIAKVVRRVSGDWPSSIKGILIANNDPATAIEVELPFVGRARPADAAAANTEAAKKLESGPGEKAMIEGVTGVEQTQEKSLGLILLFAFLGGLILNVMPCVLPVISLKILSFVSTARQVPGRLRKLGLVYGLGILVSFALLAVFSIVVHKAGGIADWGSAFRNPQFRIIITVLILLVALNLFGLFEVTLGGKTMGAAGQLASKQGYVGAFFNGVLATILATPCTAPFLGTAIAFAFTQPALVTLGIFLSAGLGLALPFVILCWQPWMLVFFPKPGVWMQQFKTGVGFAVLATAVWLFWFTSTRMGKDAVLWFGLFLVLISFTAWLWGQFMQRSSRRSPVVSIMLLAALIFGYGYVLEHKINWRHYAPDAKDGIEWQVWSPEAVAKACREGHPVLVDFTADSCLNCKFNKMTSLEITATREKLKEINAVAFVADYTDENPVIARELVRFKRAGVPMVLVYPGRANAEPELLPTILNPSVVLHSLEKAGRLSKK